MRVVDNGRLTARSTSQRAKAQSYPRATHGYGSATERVSPPPRGKVIVIGGGDRAYDFSKLERFMVAIDRRGHGALGRGAEDGINEGAMP
jgi:hypothetical protein